MSQQSDLEELSVDMDKLSENIDESDDESSVITDIDDIEDIEDIEDMDDLLEEGKDEGVEESKASENPQILNIPEKSKKQNKQLYIEKDDDGRYLEIENEEDEDEEESESDENYLMKFDKEVRENYIVNFHPETIINNYSEIQSLIQVVRDKSGMIVDPLHRTVPFLTKYEQTRIIGQRTKQLNNGSKPFIKVDEDIIDGYVIALKELEQKKIPFIIRRPLPNGGSEYWKLEDLQLLN